MLTTGHFNSDFFRRLKFYVFGFLLGLICVSVLFKGRSVCRMPSTIKLKELASQNIEYTKHARCRMECRKINEAGIKLVLQNGSVNYSKSKPQDKPCPTYAIEGYTANARHVRIVIADCDTISRIVTAIDLGTKKDSCDCRD